MAEAERVDYPERKQMTIGTETLGLRITKGRFSRRGKWHPHQPCIFLLINGKRRD